MITDGTNIDRKLNVSYKLIICDFKKLPVIYEAEYFSQLELNHKS